ncbi:MAG: hypothetical protein V1750_07210 [Acidobacteriota bacterium]
MSGSSFLVMRRGGCMWAVPSVAVDVVRTAPRGVLLVAGETRLVADEVVAFSDELKLRPPSRILARLWPHPCAGLALYAGEPVVVVDPANPPPGLGERAQEPVGEMVRATLDFSDRLPEEGES